MPWDDLSGEIGELFGELSGHESVYALDSWATLATIREEFENARRREMWAANPEPGRAATRAWRARQIEQLGRDAVRARETANLNRHRARIRADPERHEAHKAKERARVARYTPPPEVRERKNVTQRAKRELWRAANPEAYAASLERDRERMRRKRAGG